MKTSGDETQKFVKVNTRKAATIFASAAACFLFLNGIAIFGAMKAKQAATQTQSKSAPSPDLSKQPTLYVVGYAHLDTEWRWDYPQTISEYLPKTMRNNFRLFREYPHYIFNFTGANRYMMMKEYYPADYAKLKRYVAEGRWFPAGSSMEENDVNSPSPESIIRQVLYGNEFFRHEFGKASEEYMLPDCFGFPASLPTILAHAGIKGFSTQKLNAAWQPAARVGGPNSPEETPEGIPFNVGVWYGPDGESVIAALNPGDYSGGVSTDLSRNNPLPSEPPARPYVYDWPDRVNLDGKVTGVFADYHYVGTGDIGGAPSESSVKLMEEIVTKGMAVLPQPGSDRPAPVRVGTGPLNVIWSNADQMFRDIKPEETRRMPSYKGDLELINHSAGSITSQAEHKKWNRENEVLAGDAEAASVAAMWLGGRPYPQARLNHAWRLVLAGQFHDLMAGTATPQSYNYAWNDDVIAMNQFSGVLTSAVEAVSSVMNTETPGTAIVVYNLLNIPRQDVVEAHIAFPGGAPQAVRVVGPDGKETPSQLDGINDGVAKVLFLASAPSVGFAVYDVQFAESASSTSSPLKVGKSSLENGRYRVKIDENGDVSSIFDKKLNRELLSGPIRLAISTDNPEHWPAWNMDFDDEQRAPRAYVSGPATVRVVERGPVRVAVEITRQAEGSIFVQTIRLAAGQAGDRVEFANRIHWMTKAANLKAVFPLAASNKIATYNWGVGTIERPNETERQFEVASHQWIDLTDQSGAFGATILSDYQLGSDKPDDHTIRLTLVRTPGTRGGYPDQGSQDWGTHQLTFGLVSHAGDWRHAQTDWKGYELNMPLVAFESSKHPGFLGKEFSMLRVSNTRVRLMAMKKAEENDSIVVRLVEMSGHEEPGVRISFASPVVSAREVNGQEQPLGPATVRDGSLVASFRGYQPRTFEVRLAPPRSKALAPVSRPVELTYDASVATDADRPAEGCFDCNYDTPSAQGQGAALPAEMLPAEINYAGIHLHLAPAGAGRPNAMTANGQTVRLPEGQFNRLYILAAAYGGDQQAVFKVGGVSMPLTIENWNGFIGQWDNRLWQAKTPLPALAAQNPHQEITAVYAGLEPGYIKRAPVAWFASHIHNSAGQDVPYSYSYLFAYGVNLPAGAKTLTLPDNPRIRILAVSVAEEPARVAPAQPLYDVLALKSLNASHWMWGNM